MAGGTFKMSQPKVRPGTYVNLENGSNPVASSSTKGVGTIPLIKYDWGPRGQWIVVTAASPDEHIAKFGRSVYDDSNSAMRMLQLMLLGTATVYVYIPDGGTKASKDVTMNDVTMKVTAKYKGTLGNTIKLVSVANPLKGFDVSVRINGSEVEVFECVEKVEDLLGKSAYVDITGSGNMAAFASQSLENGTDDTEGKAGITDYLDKSEKIKFNTMCFPTEEASLQTALHTKIIYIRECIGWKCQAVVPNYDADYEGIINLVNSFVYGEIELSTAEACAWLAGMRAGADYVTSLTYKTVTGATAVVGEMNNEASIEAIKAGKTFFTVAETGKVVLEYDINSLVSISEDIPQDLYKNRPLSVYDTFANDLLMTFVPNSFDNGEDAWEMMEGLGRALLQKYDDDHAIKNVDLEADFVVDKGISTRDYTYFRAGLQPVDSAEKFYATVIAR